MQKPTIADLITLIRDLVVPFYGVHRDAVIPNSQREFENDAEHSWSLALLACALAPKVDPELDLGMVAQFAIVHDLVEVHAGDTSPLKDPTHLETKAEREHEAFMKIRSDFSHLPWIHKTIELYESKRSREAKYVWAVDKLIILIFRYLDKGKYYVDTGITRRVFDDLLKEHRKKAHAHEQVGQYYDQILKLFESHPEYFATEKNTRNGQ